MSGVKLLDLFSGIGGFHLGFERAGFEFDYVGFAEVDKYASAVYKYNNPFAKELGDVKSIRSENLPKIDIITFGSPCQDFSIAGKRAGATEGTRSSLIWEAIRLITECKPRVFVWENVKGTFSSNDGADFWAIIQAFTNIGSYRLEWQLLNTRWFLPQNRERLYLVGYTGDRGGRSIFPIGEPSQGNDHRNTKVANTLQHSGHSGGNYRGMTMILDPVQARREGKMRQYEEHSPTITSRDYKEPRLVQTFTERSFDGKRADGGRAIRYHKVPGETPCLSSQMGMGGNNVPMLKVGELKITAKKRSYDTPKEINEYLKANKNGKTIREIAESLDLPKTQVEHYFRSDKSRAIPIPDHWLLLKKLLGFDDTFDKEVTDIYEKEVEFESSRRVYSAEGISKTLDTHESGYYQVRQTSIRRLTPVECMRLQGFPDNHNEFGLLDGKKVAISDTQRYKQAGNAVTVDVVAAVARKIKELL